MSCSGVNLSRCPWERFRGFQTHCLPLDTIQPEWEVKEEAAPHRVPALLPHGVGKPQLHGKAGNHALSTSCKPDWGRGRAPAQLATVCIVCILSREC